MMRIDLEGHFQEKIDKEERIEAKDWMPEASVSYTHLTLPTNREV